MVANIELQDIRQTIWNCFSIYACHLIAERLLMCGCRTLEVLQDQVEPGPVEDVAEVLQRELGAPASQLFAEFEPEARAAASLAQVLPPVHAYIGTSLCVHHTATCSCTLRPDYVHVTLSHTTLHCSLNTGFFCLLGPHYPPSGCRMH